MRIVREPALPLLHLVRSCPLRSLQYARAVSSCTCLATGTPLAHGDEQTTHAREWGLQQVRELAQVKLASESCVTLGVVTGDVDAFTDQLKQKVEVNRSMQQKVQICNDIQTEHVMLRQCLGINKVNHILRVHGQSLWQEKSTLALIDDVQRSSLDRMFPGIGEEGHQQATLAASAGGLGWRAAATTALPANLAALVLGAPKIKFMAKAATTAGLIPAGLMESMLDTKVASVRANFLNELHEVEKVKAEAFLDRAVQSSNDAWEALGRGSGPSGANAPLADATYVSDGQVPTIPAHDGDEGVTQTEAGSRSINTSHVQGQLARLLDCTRTRKLEEVLAAKCMWSQLRRLKELRHKETCHSWLWHINPVCGSVMAETDYVLNVQKRLGAKVLHTECFCRVCGKLLDPCLNHSEVCAIGEATRGHYAVVRSLVDGIRIADPAVTTEPRGLTRTQARPADVFTSAAVPGRSAALDVCITSPDSAAAGADAAESAFRRKLTHYADVIPELRSAGIAFRPMIWTADGRPHPAVTRTLKFAAGIAARRQGGGEATPGMMARWRHEIGVAIMRRRAAMMRAVLPKPSAKELWMVTGAPGDDDMLGRLAEIDLDDLDNEVV